VVVVPSTEVVLFVVVALLAGGLTMGGVTRVYFLDKWRDDDVPQEAAREPQASPFDRAA
jgi:hypothetical protein